MSISEGKARTNQSYRPQSEIRASSLFIIRVRGASPFQSTRSHRSMMHRQDSYVMVNPLRARVHGCTCLLFAIEHIAKTYKEFAILKDLSTRAYEKQEVPFFLLPVRSGTPYTFSSRSPSTLHLFLVICSPFVLFLLLFLLCASVLIPRFVVSEAIFGANSLADLCMYVFLGAPIVKSRVIPLGVIKFSLIRIYDHRNAVCINTHTHSSDTTSPYLR